MASITGPSALVTTFHLFISAEKEAQKTAYHQRFRGMVEMGS